MADSPGPIVSLALHVKAAPRDPSEAGGPTRAARFFDALKAFAIAHGGSYAGPFGTTAAAVFDRDAGEEATAVALEALDLGRAVDALDPLVVQIGFALGPAAASESGAAAVPT